MKLVGAPSKEEFIYIYILKCSLGGCVGSFFITNSFLKLQLVLSLVNDHFIVLSI
jgi:hypothetical protein